MVAMPDASPSPRTSIRNKPSGTDSPQIAATTLRSGPRAFQRWIIPIVRIQVSASAGQALTGIFVDRNPNAWPPWA